MRTFKGMASLAVAVGLISLGSQAEAQRVQVQTTNPSASFQGFAMPTNASPLVAQSVRVAEQAVNNLSVQTVTIGGRQVPGLTGGQLRILNQGFTRGGVAFPALPVRIQELARAGQLNSNTLTATISTYVSAVAEVSLETAQNASMAAAVNQSISQALVEVNSTELASIDAASLVDAQRADRINDAQVQKVNCGLLSMIQEDVSHNAGATNQQFQSAELRAANTQALETLYAEAGQLDSSLRAAGVSLQAVQSMAWALVDGQTTPRNVLGVEDALRAFFQGSADKLETSHIVEVSMMIVQTMAEVAASGASNAQSIWYGAMEQIQSRLAAIVGEEEAIRIVAGEDGIINNIGGVAGECPVNFGIAA